MKTPNIENKDYMTLISNVYSRHQNIKHTAIELGISDQKTRKILLSLGLVEENTKRKLVMFLYNEGKKIDQIAKLLSMGRSTVYSYIPYVKGIYNAPKKTKNALRIEAFRQRKNGSMPC